MKRVIFMIGLTMAIAAFGAEQTFTGIVTDSMCGRDHAAMKISPDAKCVQECVKTGGSTKYALNDGRNVYRLSDQQTPARFAGQRVKVTGILFPKTGIIQTTRIERAR